MEFLGSVRPRDFNPGTGIGVGEGRGRQISVSFSQVNVGHSRPARATEIDPVSKEQNKSKHNNKY